MEIKNSDEARQYLLARKNYLSSLHDDSKLLQPSATYSAGAFVVLAGLLFYNQISADFEFEGGAKVRYTGNLWGLLPLPAITGVAAWFNTSPGDLIGLGNCDCQVAEGVFMELTWFKDGRIIGGAVGGGLTPPGIGGGPGHFVGGV